MKCERCLLEIGIEELIQSGFVAATEQQVETASDDVSETDEEEQHFGATTENRMQSAAKKQCLGDGTKVSEHSTALQQSIDLEEGVGSAAVLGLELSATVTDTICNQIEGEHTEEVDNKSA